MEASGLSKAKTKDEFLNKAHEARQAREIARRQDDAATKLQSHMRRYLTCTKLRKEMYDEQKELESALRSGDSSKFLSILKKILFFGRLEKDEDMIKSTLRFIQDLPQSLEPSTDERGSQEPSATRPSFRQLVLEFAANNEETFESCINVILSIMGLCCKLTNQSISSNSDLQSLVIYIRTINLFTTSGSPLLAQDQEQLRQTYERLIARLSDKTQSLRRGFYLDISNAMAKAIKGPRTDAKARFLQEYILLAVDCIESDRARQDKSNEIRHLLKLFSIPALMYNLQQYSPDSIEQITEKFILARCLELMCTNDPQLQNLTSTPALCLVANLIHLSSIVDDTLVANKMTFVTTVTKLFEYCQRNMKQTASGKAGSKRSSRKQNESTDESFNHILGWLTRESVSHTIDQETSKLIKIQLSHLWSVKFLKMLLSDLVTANENQKSKKTHNNGAGKPLLSVKNKSPSGVSPARRESSGDNQITCDYNPQTAAAQPLSTFKRAVERAAYNMTKSIGYPYVKTTSSSGSHSSCAKLLSEEARRISLVCLMLHTALKTLKIVKQDILTGLCFHDYVLRNMWDFICSLGPQNGLKAFLDHLAIHTKSSIPEFHILMLFCECASHIISILDDSELYEQQKPFTLEDLICISTFLNTFVFRVISNQLVPYQTQDMDPILHSTHKLLTDLYKRDCRRRFAPEDHWLIKDVKMSIFFKDLDANKPVAHAILTLLPHIIPHKVRVLIFRKLVSKDRARYSTCYSTFITIHRSRIVEDGYQQLARLPSTALKGLIRVKFINDHGLDEAGIDQDGVFKEFLEDSIKRVFDPGLNLFSTTSEQRLYPSPTSRLHDDHLSLFNFVGKMLGKAVYEGIVVDVPFASFFLSRVLGQHHCALYSPIDELASLDPELYKNLIYIRHHDVSDLDLTFSIDQDMMGKIETYELEPGGKFVPVTNESRVRYIHSVAKFRMKTQIEEQTDAFVRGFGSIINLEWLQMFSATEFQRLISGDTAPIDLQDLRRNTKYFGGFHNNHRVVCWLWDILETDFTPEEHRLFLKFVTSCSKPPLLGFANLEPPFSIRCVEVSDDQDLGDTVGSVLRGFFAIRRSDPVDRLPTSSTCFNLLKLPNYQRRSTLREKLRYAIRSSPGFELS